MLTKACSWSQVNTVHILLTSRFFKIHLDIVISSTPSSRKWQIHLVSLLLADLSPLAVRFQGSVIYLVS
jgi:hypothetical protein